MDSMNRWAAFRLIVSLEDSLRPTSFQLIHGLGLLEAFPSIHVAPELCSLEDLRRMSQGRHSQAVVVGKMHLCPLLLFCILLFSTESKLIHFSLKAI